MGTICRAHGDIEPPLMWTRKHQRMGSFTKSVPTWANNEIDVDCNEQDLRECTVATLKSNCYNRSVRPYS